ncbi:TonB-dependent receptor [Flavobacterium sp.]|uniref:TonB-dependent receptor n=1 Tax=Flavobacterium sp. TaxID=239 RepID=UPI00260C194F|nr:TonB-dependent receptor [Flavobacterium sp.]MDD3003435.1 TonB-dependent receptor [Flavobacterium sp.]
MKLKFLFIAFLFCTLGYAQSKGKVTGMISDADLNNEAMPFVNVMIKGTTNGIATDLEGKYELSVAPGSHILQISFVGYETLEVPFEIKSNQTLVLDKSMSSGSVKLEDVVIQSRSSRANETVLLQDQKNAIEIKQNIGSQELSRKGVSDVANAVTKTTGITKQEGTGTIYVRGLGDRYNSTTLNGLPIPSNDPEKKNIDLGIFSTDIVEYISIDKIYGAKMYGDFAGGNVDIMSKDFKGKSLIEVEIGSSLNSNAVAQNDFMLQQGPNKSGFSNSDIPNDPLNSYSFKNSLAPVKENPIAGNISIKGGKTFDFGGERKLHLFATASFENEYLFREGINKSVNAQGAKLKSFEQKNYSYTTTSTGLFNAAYRFNEKNKINYNFMFINSSSQVNDEYKGFIRDIAENDNGLVRRGTYIQNQLMVNQLLGSHKLTDQIAVNWATSMNRIQSQMPDRTQNTLWFNENNNGYSFAVNTTTDNHRYYQNLVEDEFAINVSSDYQFLKNDSDEFKAKLTIGYNGKFKTRDFEATQFNFNISNSQSNAIVNPYNLDAFFNAQNFNNGYFSIETFSGNNIKPQTYNGTQNIHAAFGLLQYKLTPKTTAIFGLRAEQIFQDVTWKTQIDNSGRNESFERNEFLPSLLMKYEVNDKNNLRLAASKTYTLPQFKERALFVYEDVTEVKVGNPYLYPSEDYNLDLKWEFFPKNDELISVTFFGKYIVNPINEITLASSTNDISFINTGDWGRVFGAEFEIRKNIVQFGTEKDQKLTAGLNASYMQTNQELNSEKVRKETDYNINLTRNEDAFTGASDLLINADVSYLKEWSNSQASIMATLAYSYFSDRIYALGTEMKGNLVDKAIGTLDLIVRSKLNKQLGINFSAKNLLDPKIERIQDNDAQEITVLSYKKGLFFGLGVSYQF